MPAHRLLNLARGDVFSAAPYVVRLAIDEEQLAVLVETAEVASVQPQVPKGREGRLGLVVVSAEKTVRGLWPYDDLPYCAWRLDHVVLVDDLHLEVGLGPA